VGIACAWEMDRSTIALLSVNHTVHLFRRAFSVTQYVHLSLTRHHKSWCLCSNCVKIRTGNTQDYSESCVDSDLCQLLQTSASKGVHAGNAVPSIVRWILSISKNAVLGPLPGTWANISDLWWAP